MMISPEPSDYLNTLSQFGAGFEYRTVAEPVREQIGWILADTLAAIAAGSAEPELRAVASRQPFADEAGLIGLHRRSTCESAAFINGTAGTFLEMDEGNRFARGHPAIHVIPAAMAISQKRGASAEDFIAAVMVGYEVGSRLGAASSLRGAMHPHGTWGTIGAAAAAGRVAQVDASAMRQIINIASSLTTASSKQTMLEGGLVRNTYAGLSNRNGLLALDLAECGFSGERDGPTSLMEKIISERFDPAAVVADLGADWHLMHNYFKLHSCCRYNHGTLDALDHLAARGVLPAPAMVDRVEVDTYNLAAELNDPAPANTLAAKFSVPFAVATRLVNGSSRLASFTWDAVRSQDVLELAQRVAVRHDPAMSARLPMERPARVVLYLKTGEVLLAEAGVNRGDDAAPYTREELHNKFLDLTSRIWPLSHCEMLLNETLALCRLEIQFKDWLTILERQPLGATR